MSLLCCAARWSIVVVLKYLTNKVAMVMGGWAQAYRQGDELGVERLHAVRGCFLGTSLWRFSG